jgi:hypothetical protein
MDLPPLIGAVFGVGTPAEWGSLLLAPLLGRTGRGEDTAPLDAFAAAWSACVGAPLPLPLALLRYAADMPTEEEEAALRGGGRASASASPPPCGGGIFRCVDSTPLIAISLGAGLLLLAIIAVITTFAVHRCKKGKKGWVAGKQAMLAREREREARAASPTRASSSPRAASPLRATGATGTGAPRGAATTSPFAFGLATRVLTFVRAASPGLRGRSYTPRREGPQPRGPR